MAKADAEGKLYEEKGRIRSGDPPLFIQSAKRDACQRVVPGVGAHPDLATFTFRLEQRQFAILSFACSAAFRPVRGACQPRWNETNYAFEDLPSQRNPESRVNFGR
jgi:hypothetical protein